MYIPGDLKIARDNLEEETLTDIVVKNFNSHNWQTPQKAKGSLILLLDLIFAQALARILIRMARLCYNSVRPNQICFPPLQFLSSIILIICLNLNRETINMSLIDMVLLLRKMGIRVLLVQLMNIKLANPLWLEIETRVPLQQLIPELIMVKVQ